jgi:hypothetical protein
MLIDVAASLGFVWSRKRAHGLWEKRRKRWIELYGQDPVGGLKGYPPFQVTTFFILTFLKYFQKIEFEVKLQKYLN